MVKQEYNTCQYEINNDLLGYNTLDKKAMLETIMIKLVCSPQSYIPKTLDHVKNVEEDVIRLTSGQDTGDMYYKTITGLKQALSQPAPAEEQQQQQQLDTNVVEDSSVNISGHSNSPETDSESIADSDEENSRDSEGSSSSETESQAPVDKKTARKENKKKVKEEKREARKNKVPKAVKKRKKKLAKAQKTR